MGAGTSTGGVELSKIATPLNTVIPAVRVEILENQFIFIKHVNI
ncbi:MAG: hypothetical protein ACI9NC_003266 [Verrucomicrobiales bacterium]|jgi:hypothetical protein